MNNNNVFENKQNAVTFETMDDLAAVVVSRESPYFGSVARVRVNDDPNTAPGSYLLLMPGSEKVLELVTVPVDHASIFYRHIDSAGFSYDKKYGEGPVSMLRAYLHTRKGAEIGNALDSFNEAHLRLFNEFFGPYSNT